MGNAVSIGIQFIEDEKQFPKLTSEDLYFQHHDILNDLLNNNFVKSINMIK